MQTPRPQTRGHARRRAGRVLHLSPVVLVGLVAAPLLLGGPLASASRGALAAASRGGERIEAAVYRTITTMLDPGRLVRALDGHALPDLRGE